MKSGHCALSDKQFLEYKAPVTEIEQTLRTQASKLEQSLAMRTMGDARIAVADPAYEANTGMFGGWTAALMLKAVLDHPECAGSASALTVNFVTRVLPGESLLIRPTRLGESKSLSHWRADLYRGQGTELLASASVVVALRRPSQSAMDFRVPAASSPDELSASNPPGAFGRRTETRAFYGHPPFNRADLQSMTWARENSGRHIDAVQLAYLSDVYAPRVFHISEGPRPSSTLTMSTYFLASPEELAAVGDDYVLSEAEGTRIEHSLVGSRSRLWSRQGTLLATTEQLCWFK
ncbi:MAG: thioesterase family protein [Sphingomicrobium sp.]